MFGISPEDLQYYNFYYNQISYGSWEFENTTGRNSEEVLGEYRTDLQVSFGVVDVAKSKVKTLTGLSVDGGTIDTLTVGPTVRWRKRHRLPPSAARPPWNKLFCKTEPSRLDGRALLLYYEKNFVTIGRPAGY